MTSDDRSVDLPHHKAEADYPLTSLHDLNNMFGAAMGSLQLVARRHGDDQKTSLLVNNALTSLQHIQDAVRHAFMKRVDAVPPGGFDPSHKLASGHATVSAAANGHDLFFAAIEMTRMPMIVTDPNQADNPVIFANQAFLNTTGYEMSEVLHKNCRFLQGPGTDPDTVANVRRAIKERTDIAVEIQNYRKDGTMFWNALFVSPIFDRDGKLLYFFGSQLDITRRREAESALRRAQKMEAIGQLTGGIAHDFNNLLQVIIGNMQLARSVIDKPDKIVRYNDAVVTAAEKAKALTQQLLAFSRKQPLEARVVNLNRVLTELRDLLSKTLGSHIEIDLDLARDLANADIDIIQLEMAVINVLANARDAMPEGGKVTVSTRNLRLDTAHRDDRFGGLKPGTYVSLAIKDTGTGMPPEVLARITEPFFTTKGVGKGTGLGLAQVYGFVNQSEGGFAVDTEAGQGTTIIMTFPATTDALYQEVPPVRVEMAGPQGKGEQILIVEDNKEVRELACAILEQEGYTIFEAVNAQDGLDKLATTASNVDMVFTDIVMPGQMSGVALAKSVRKSRPNMAILITTGFAEDVHGHTNSTEFETIYKPYMPDELAAKVRSVLNRKMDHRA
ncbi:histidine kinase famiy protein [Asticcacaulis sp. YBE204]|uniref:histidine kinase famiy protein n=1 Tax=Asticcacaulis sp. YBE204 TaxID=1282363 RepID=UPI0003C40EEE|nr:histidine kinase famiy protein [Asticcacaulis sp. YBE204]ESQ79429.1 hypothetical protein AEYBE204_10505 [Asticcacaulis sp. YBE204]